MSPVRLLLARFGYVKISDHGFQLTPDGRLVPLDDTWSAPGRSAPAPATPVFDPVPPSALAPPARSPRLPAIELAPAAVDFASMLAPPPAGTAAEPAASGDDDEWEWQMALARARAAADPLADDAAAAGPPAIYLDRSRAVSGELTALASPRAIELEDAPTASIEAPVPLAQVEIGPLRPLRAPSPARLPRASHPADGEEDETREGSTQVFDQAPPDSTDAGVTSVLARVDPTRRPLGRVTERARRQPF